MRRNIDEKGKKLFIGGLHMKTTESSLNEFYSQWGEIVDCVVMKDPASGRSRGFGFVTYKDAESVDLAQNSRPHELDGIKVDSKRAMPKEDTSPEFHASVNRLFLGKLKRTVTNEDLYEYFGQFGSITDAVVIKNPSGESRGFGFVTFEDTDSVDKIVVSRPHSIDGSIIEVKKAQPKDDKNPGKSFDRTGNRNQSRGGARQQSNFNSRYSNDGNSYGGYSAPDMGYNSGYGDYSQTYSGYQGGGGGIPPVAQRYDAGPVAGGGGDEYGQDSYYNGGGYGAMPASQAGYGTAQYGSGYGTVPPMQGGGGAAPTLAMGDYSQQRAGGGPVRGGAAKYGRGAAYGMYPY